MALYGYKNNYGKEEVVAKEALENVIVIDNEGAVTLKPAAVKAAVEEGGVITAGRGISIVENEVSTPAVLSVSTGSVNGTISVDGTNVPVQGINTAAYQPESHFVAAEANKRLMTTEEGTKLAGIEAGAEKNVQADWAADDVALGAIANKPEALKNPNALTITPAVGSAVVYDGSNTGTLTIDNAAVGLGAVTNDKQIKGLASGTTAGNVVVFGADGFTVADSGHTIAKDVPADADFTSGVTSITVTTDGVITGGSATAVTKTGTFNLAHSTSGIGNSGKEVGPQSDPSEALTHGSTFIVPNIVFDKYGHATGAVDRTYTLPSKDDKDTSYVFSEGTTNGKFVVTPYIAQDGGEPVAQDPINVTVHGLGSAAYTNSNAYATAAQGTKADSAVQSVGAGSSNGTISVDGANVSVTGLKSAAFAESSAFAAASHNHDGVYVKTVGSGSGDGKIAVDGVDVAVTGFAGLATSVSGNTSSITAINDKIPAAATSSNQLADKAFVNSTVATNTSNYISDNGQPFTDPADLPTTGVTNNDYAVVTGTDATGNTYFDRYKAHDNAGTITWAKEYRINNSSFTAVQWAAIESGITAEAVAQIGTNELDIAANAAAISTLDNAVDTRIANATPVYEGTTKGMVPPKTNTTAQADYYLNEQGDWVQMSTPDLSSVVPKTTKVAGAALSGDISVATLQTNLGLGSAAYAATGDFATAGHDHTGTYVPVGRKVNNKALSSDVTLVGSDVALTGYTISGTANQAVAATDTINAAIGKLEKTLSTKTTNTGTITSVAGDGTYITGSATSGGVTLSHKLPTTSPAGSYGESANRTLASQGTFKVPYVTVDAAGHATGMKDVTLTLPASANPPTFSGSTAGLVPASDGSSSKYLNGAGSWATISAPGTLGVKNLGDAIELTNTTAVTSATATSAALKVTGGIISGSGITGAAIYNAVWNDLADCITVNDECDLVPGKCYAFDGENYYPTEKYMDDCIIGIHSDTAGMIMGQKANGKELHVGVAGFVLAYVDDDYKPGTVLTSGEDGVLTVMKPEDKASNPDKIVATFWKAEDAEEWGPEGKKIKVNGRKWVKIV